MPKMWTKDELKAAFEKKLLRTGEVKCPTCEHVAKHDHQDMLVSPMFKAQALMAWYSLNGTAWTDVYKVLREIGRGRMANGGTFAKLRHWGLVEPGDGKGIWRITEKGERFLNGKSRVWRTIVVTNIGQKFVGFAKEKGRVTIDEALGPNFNLKKYIEGK